MIKIRKVFTTTVISLSIFPAAFGAKLDFTNSKVIDFRYENGESLIFNLDSNPNPEILDPAEFEGQYLLVRAGVKSFSTTSKRSTTYFKTIDENTCNVENAYDNDFTSGNSDFFINEKTRIFRTCLKYQVSDPAGGTVEFEPTQLNCTLKKINDSTVLITGGDCFFKAKAKQILNVNLYPNPECLNRQFLVEKNIAPMEIVTQLEAFIYPEKEIGKVFTATKTLWEKSVFINLNSGKELLNTVTKEDKLDRSFFRPAQLIYPNIMISDLKIQNSRENSSGLIDLGILISGFGGQEICIQGLCSNYQNYDYPFTPLAIISLINPRNGKKEELAARYIGGRMPSKWMGEFRAMTFFSDFKFEKGNKYAIDLIFSDPTYDYQEFAKTYKTKLNLETLTTTNRVIGRDTIREFRREVPGLSSVREVGTIQPLDINLFKGLPSGMLDDLPRIFESLADETFPPEYAQVCNQKGSCRDARKGNHLNFTIEFEVKEENGPRVILGDSLTVERKGPLFPNYKTKITNKPTIKCRRN